MGTQTLKNVIKGNMQNVKDVSEGKLMYLQQALEKFKYDICDLLNIPPDACMTEEQWRHLINQSKKR